MLWADVPHPDSIDALAAALRADPVVVQETLGSGDAAGADDRLSELVRRLPFKAYVALVDAPDDAADAGIRTSRYLATALSRRIGEPGLYVVETGGVLGMRLVGTGWDETAFSNQYYTDAHVVEELSGSSLLTPAVDAEVVVRAALAGPPEDYRTPTLSDETAAELAAREKDLQPFDRPSLDDAPESWTSGKRWMVGTTAGLGALLLYLQTLRGWQGWQGWPGRRRRPASRAVVRGLGRPAPVPPDPDALRRSAEAEVTALAEELAEAPAGPHLDSATLAREVAEPLLDSDDVLDVVGALVLARTGRRDVRRARGQARAPYRACFLDPRHDGGTRTAEWRFGDATVTVPVCPRCDHLLEVGRAPAPLSVRRGARTRPYYEGRSVWARTGFGGLVDDLASEVAAERRAERRGER